MRKLINPERPNQGYACYGCSSGNARGLQMEFWEDNDDIVAYWNPGPDFQSYENILHGGVQMALLDETACWVMMVKAGTYGYTRRMEFEFNRHVFINRGQVVVRGRLIRIGEGIAYIELTLSDNEGEVRTRALAEYFVVPAHIAAKRMNYPGMERFFAD